MLRKLFGRVVSERGLLGTQHPAEIANVATHGIGLALSFPAVLWLLGNAEAGGEFWSCAVYGATLVIAYAASTCLHIAVMLSAEHRLHYALEVTDHAAIYSFIAGTFTPFFIRIGGTLGNRLLVCGWAMAMAGIAFKVIFGLKHHRLSLASYLLMGWFPTVTLEPVLRASSFEAVAFLVAGGVAYTAGVPFFIAAVRRPRLHAVWHLFVMLGSTCHYVAVALATAQRS